MRCSFQPFLSATNPNLHTQDISHGLSCFFLRRSGDVGVGIQGEACGEVAQLPVTVLIHIFYLMFKTSLKCRSPASGEALLVCFVLLGVV
jgi:hypothetical protein